MSVRTVTHWRGGSLDEILPIARTAKAIWAKYGGDMQLGRAQFGPEVGQWVVMITFKDWEALGKAQQAISSDQQYNALFADLTRMSELTARRIITSIDL